MILAVSINGRPGKSKGSLISGEVFEQEFYLTTEEAVILLFSPTQF
ncbi:MAG: hypothetical protein LUO83_04750 [Methanothrix sp.]|nr:hypothetical protein [Methanothrix sp.]